jgi:hypothetical protein
MEKFFAWFLSYLFPAVAGDDLDPDPDPVEPDPEPEDPEPDADPDAADPEPEPEDPPAGRQRAISRAQQAIIDARKRAQDAEARAERLEREAAEARSRANPPQPTPDQRLHEQEEAKLRDPNTSDVERWQIQSNRTLRQAQQDASAARLEARDLNDKAEFRLKAVEDPRIKQYADRVETELAKMRAQGQNAPREAIYTFLLGQDVRAGKVKATAAAPKPKGSLPDSARGKPTGVRSDVSGKARKTESEQRRKRLEGINI